MPVHCCVRAYIRVRLNERYSTSPINTIHKIRVISQKKHHLKMYLDLIHRTLIRVLVERFVVAVHC